jgi:hypothetical protein
VGTTWEQHIKNGHWKSVPFNDRFISGICALASTYRSRDLIFSFISAVILHVILRCGPGCVLGFIFGLVFSLVLLVHVAAVIHPVAVAVTVIIAVVILCHFNTSKKIFFYINFKLQLYYGCILMVYTWLLQNFILQFSHALVWMRKCVASLLA